MTAIAQFVREYLLAVQFFTRIPITGRLADWVGFLDAGRLVLAEPVDSLLRRFRMIEVTFGDAVGQLPANSGWLPLGAVGRMLRFIDTNHAAPDAMARIAAAFPGADIRDSPVSLREIFVALARHGASTTEAA